jgi:hypothetical protein
MENNSNTNRCIEEEPGSCVIKRQWNEKSVIGGSFELLAFKLNCRTLLHNDSNKNKCSIRAHVTFFFHAGLAEMMAVQNLWHFGYV